MCTNFVCFPIYALLRWQGKLMNVKFYRNIQFDIGMPDDCIYPIKSTDFSETYDAIIINSIKQLLVLNKNKQLLG